MVGQGCGDYESGTLAGEPNKPLRNPIQLQHPVLDSTQVDVQLLANLHHLHQLNTEREPSDRHKP
jgi:hypothetical protein